MKQTRFKPSTPKWEDMSKHGENVKPEAPRTLSPINPKTPKPGFWEPKDRN